MEVPPPERRSLVFTDLSEVMPDVGRLDAGNRTTGNWSLAQICRHLADSLAGSMDGFGVDNHRVMRWLMGRRAFRSLLTDGLAAGFTVSEKLNPPPNLNRDEMIEMLAGAIERYMAHTGALHFHPFFGHLTREEWDRLHLIHCAHHLSYAIPCSLDARS